MDDEGGVGSRGTRLDEPVEALLVGVQGEPAEAPAGRSPGVTRGTAMLRVEPPCTANFSGARPTSSASAAMF